MFARPSLVLDTRNVAVIAHVDHGKTTLSDALLHRAGVLSADKAGDQSKGRALDTSQEERERGITIKSTGITMDYAVSAEHFAQADREVASRCQVPASVAPLPGDDAPRQLTMNLIDSPGHVDFSGEVTAALRMTDGCLVVVDAVEGKSPQTETVLLQALRERVKPVLFLNKVDRLILEKQLEPPEVYDRFIEVTAQINAVIEANQDPSLPDMTVSLAAGSVAFGSGYFQWSASLDTFVDIIKPGTADRAGARRKLAKRQTFVSSVLGPIFQIHRELGLLPDVRGGTATADAADADAEGLAAWLLKFNARMAKLGRRPVDLGRADQAPKKLLKVLMASFLPAADPILHMVMLHLPSPVEAQAYRMASLYDRNDDGVLPVLRTCSASAPLLLFVSKMVQASEFGSTHGSNGLLAVCRIFSGTVSAGQAVRLVGSSDAVKVAQVKQCVGRRMRDVGTAIAGQIVMLSGVSGQLTGTGTLTTFADAADIRPMTFSVAPVVLKSIAPADPRQLKKMVGVAKAIVAADPTALFYTDPGTNEHVLAGAGELHLEVLVNTIEKVHGLAVRLSDPMVNYREGLAAGSDDPALKKSANKHNRLWFTASPVEPALIAAMDAGDVSGTDLKLLSRQLQAFAGWDKHAATRVWAVGPEQGMANGSGVGSGLSCILVNSTTGLQVPPDARDTIVAAFKQVVTEGLLAGSEIRGVRFDLVDARFHAESTHRSTHQVLPAAKSAMRGAMLKGEPVLIEPFFTVEVKGAPGTINAAYNVLTGQRRGRILESGVVAGGRGIDAILAEVPVRLSFGLADQIRSMTSGKGFVTTSFGGWQRVPGDPADPDGGEARTLVEDQRNSKRMPRKVPSEADFCDRL